MRLTTVRLSGDRTAAARVERRRLVLLPFPDVSAILATGEHWQDHTTAPSTPSTTASDAGPLVTGLAVLIETGVNYAARARELGAPRPDAPELFTTPVDRLVGDRDTVHTDRAADLRWGVELGVVIGRETSRVSPASALGHVAGYTAVTVVAAPGQPATVAVGPQLVTPDELPLGARGLVLTATHDGRLRQRATTSDLLFDVATLIAHASATTTLVPGDLLTTGTPAGAATDPLEDGSEIVAAVKGIGELHLTVAGRSGR
ncbi:fumarylacetoacetate hydrolase family protein [Streptomyces sp. NPDC091281]|uniref:fumarylacetoacetate hydrolase family protein n=1 Tax=Streptomyces sp. NPDC091281 TaxID=3365985 RepID=UPI00382C4D0E